MSAWRPASAQEVSGLWPVARTRRVARSEQQLLAGWRRAPWTVRVSAAGDAMLLAPWRAASDALAIRAVWAPPSRVSAAVAEAVSAAAAHGFERVLSPLVPEGELAPYKEAGMRAVEYVVALQGSVNAVARAGTGAAVTVRSAVRGEIETLRALDAECFDEFWRYGREELETVFESDHVLVALRADERVVGYVTSSLYSGTCTVGRLAVAHQARRQGVASTLLGATARAAAADGAFAVSLCTQEHNTVSRALYAKCGLVEVAERYVIAGTTVGQD